MILNNRPIVFWLKFQPDILIKHILIKHILIKHILIKKRIDCPLMRDFLFIIHTCSY